MPQTQRSPGTVWRFANCEFDELRRELVVQGAVVELETKPLELLRQLLLHAGEVVTKEELLESVWPGVMVVDGSLANAVSKLRKALGDDQKLLTTVPRIGYRLDASVRCNTPPAPRWADLNLRPGDPVPGRDQWKLTRRLDLSAASEVWLAEHPRTHEARVFKFAPDAVRLKGLKREVTLSRLLRGSLGDRPEFVRILEWNFDRHPYFIESEYSGPNLAEWAAVQGSLLQVPIEQRIRLLIDVAKAVASAHELGVLHKDLKPGNILVSQPAEGEWQIKVADFGSAALLDPSRLTALGITNLGFTQTASADNAVTGTLMYLAPEVMAGQSPTAATDIYALGVLLYQLACGDFRKPLAPGWEADIADPLLREDIADAACGDPVRRLGSAAKLADRLSKLHERRAERERIDEVRRRTERRQNRLHAWYPRLAIASAVLLLVASGLLIVRRKASPRASQKLVTIAVLPFENSGADPGLDFLRFALPDEVTTTLSHIHGLSVRPFATTGRYNQPNVDPQKAGQEMQVNSVVVGRFVPTKEQLHITLEAIDVQNNRVLWRDQADAPLESMIATQEQIVLRVREGLAPALGAKPSGVATQPQNEEAYTLFMRSVALGLDPSNNPKGLAMLEQSVKLDPKYPPSWLALARRYYTEARYTSGDKAVMEHYEEALNRAVGLDPDYVPAVAGLIVSQVERGDLVTAYRKASELVERHPDSAEAHFAMSYVLRFAGLLRESAEHCERALLLDAHTQTVGLRSCAIAFLGLQDYPRALNYIQLDLGSDWSKAFMMDVLAYQGRIQEASKLGAPDFPQWTSYTMLRACLQHKPSAKIHALAAKVQPSADPETDYMSAAHLAYCQETDAALDFLQLAVKGSYCSYPAMDKNAFFDSLRRNPRFAHIRQAGMACQANFVEQRSASTQHRPYQ